MNRTLAATLILSLTLTGCATTFERARAACGGGAAEPWCVDRVAARMEAEDAASGQTIGAVLLGIVAVASVVLIVFAASAGPYYYQAYPVYPAYPVYVYPAPYYWGY